MDNYAKIDSNQLEQTADTFFGRMSQQEVDIVKATTDDLTGYMKRLDRGPFLVAGVGGILRFEDPSIAKDIDVAIIGLKYSVGPGRARTHSFNDVTDFTRIVSDYFSNLVAGLREEYSLLQGSGATFSTGSGPFKGWNEGFEGQEGDSTVEVRSYLEEFGWYNSKGLQVHYSGSRPIDVQFVFNQTPEEWKVEQGRLEDSPLGRKGMADKFFYAVLLEHE